ncbi:MAG: MBL fold metallo-hydrolase [Defluviitaleaceae bacterium]|nr:MBL fold metallo-hydrolase [Defluviitaleaceae bacterium]
MEIIKIGTRSVIFRRFLEEWGCGLNIHLILGEHRNYLIDTGCGSGDMEYVKEYLKENNKPLVVINTHFHWDHIWGNFCFDDAIIIANKRAIEYIKDTWDSALEKHKSFIKGEAKLKMPNLTFDDEIYFEDDKIKLFYTPGHTADGISVFDEVDGVLNAGDNIGDTMDEVLPVIYDTAESLKKSLQAYKALDVAHCVSGHNVVVGKEFFEIMEEELAKNEGV